MACWPGTCRSLNAPHFQLITSGSLPSFGHHQQHLAAICRGQHETASQHCTTSRLRVSDDGSTRLRSCRPTGQAILLTRGPLQRVFRQERHSRLTSSDTANQLKNRATCRSAELLSGARFNRIRAHPTPPGRPLPRSTPRPPQTSGTAIIPPTAFTPIQCPLDLPPPCPLDTALEALCHACRTRGCCGTRT